MQRFNSRIAHRETMQMLEHIHGLLHRLIRKDTIEMSTLADIQNQSAQILAKATAEADALTAIAGAVDGYKAQLADIQAQLEAALANGDQAGIDAASASMAAAIQQIDANAVAEAALAGTPAAA